MSRLLHCLNIFLSNYFFGERPILIAVSGGPDSLALLHACSEIKKKCAYEFSVIHIDHNWRETSREEADKLGQYVQAVGLSWILETLPPPTSQSNLEERARTARFAIFHHHYLRMNAQALFLGHHSQDQAETVLKRLFEGSFITALGGMREMTSVNGMVVGRPFLSLSKEEIVEYCDEHQLPYLIDPTNTDPRFLRARMRLSLFPLLENYFGKHFQRNLVHFAQTVQELADYCTGQFVEVQEGDSFFHLAPFEAKWKLKQMAEKHSLKLGQKQLSRLYDLIKIEDGVVRKFQIKNHTFLIRKGVVSLY
jgi:tRNA(Ile)-lysidine synthase